MSRTKRPYMHKHIDLTGARFGRLVVIGLYDRVRYAKRVSIRWKCKCDCGAEIVVQGHNLRSGNTKSCGCIRKEMASKSLKEAWKRVKEEMTHGQTDGSADCRP